ncbi:hypothetical protein S245_028890 [Arachis hypogaea]
MATPREEDYRKDNLVIQEDIFNEWNNDNSIHFQIPRVTEAFGSARIAKLKEFTDLVNNSDSEQMVSWRYDNGLKEDCYCTKKGAQAWDEVWAKNKKMYSRLEDLTVGYITAGPNQADFGTCSPAKDQTRTDGERASSEAGRVVLHLGPWCIAVKDSVVANDLTAMETPNNGQSGVVVPRRGRDHLDADHGSIRIIEGDAGLRTDGDEGFHGPHRNMSRRPVATWQDMKGVDLSSAGGTDRNAEEARVMSEGADAVDEERSLNPAIADEGSSATGIVETNEGQQISKIEEHLAENRKAWDLAVESGAVQYDEEDDLMRILQDQNEAIAEKRRKAKLKEKVRRSRPKKFKQVCKNVLK